jgi:UDP-N-acetylmuramate dehydrogenase
MMLMEDIGIMHSELFAPFRDRLRENVDMSRTNWFRVGGPAQWLFRPENAQDLSEFFCRLPLEIPTTVLGVGSNVIIRDGGIDGVVIRLGRGFAGIGVYEGKIEAGAGALDVNIAQIACDHELAGLEFLSGIPGTIGGAVCMNAGAYGSDMSKILMEAEIVERSGRIRRLSNLDLGFTYRSSRLSRGAVVTQVLLNGHPGDQRRIARRIGEIQHERDETQPVRARTGGSTFRNPIGHKAWELIDRSRCRGLTVGDAQISEKHCNFMINTGQATATDLEVLGEEVRQRVYEATGIELEWEIKRIGKPAQPPVISTLAPAGEGI